MTTYAQFEAQKPTGGWFKITDAQLDVPDATWFASKLTGERQEVFVPLRPRGEDKPGTKVHVLLEVDDESTKKLVDEMGQFDKSNAKESDVLQYMLKNSARLYPKRPVEGMIKFGATDLKSTDRQKIANLNPNLAPDFVVLEENARPNGGASLLMLIAGLAILLFSLAGFAGGKSEEETAQATPEGGTTPPTGSAPQPPMSGGNAG